MDNYPYTNEFYQNGWRFESYADSLEDAIDEADELHHRTGYAQRVVDAEGNEVYRTDGKSDFTNR